MFSHLSFLSNKQSSPVFDMGTKAEDSKQAQSPLSQGSCQLGRGTHEYPHSILSLTGEVRFQCHGHPGCKLDSVPLFSFSGLYLMGMLQRQGQGCPTELSMKTAILYPSTSQGSCCYFTGLGGH